MDRGIIFSAPMVLALLAGRKTQTRRLATSPLRRAQPGDRLWVRETCAAEELPDGFDGVRYPADGQWLKIEPTQQRALDWLELNHYGLRRVDLQAGREPVRGRKVPSIHMPRWASRLTLIVEAVRIERLAAISRADCAAEGHPRPSGVYADSLPADVHLDAARDWYMDLWDSLHREPGTRWADDPPVVALTFRVERRNIDAGAS